jgi:methionyl-tRNA synthetase
MAHLASVIFLAGMLLSPILVTKSEKIFDQLGIPAEMRTYEKSLQFRAISGLKVQKGKQLFPRLDDKAETDYIKALMAAPKEKAAA